jgi:hypothetical protein
MKRRRQKKRKEEKGGKIEPRKKNEGNSDDLDIPQS